MFKGCLFCENVDRMVFESLCLSAAKWNVWYKWWKSLIGAEHVYLKDLGSTNMKQFLNSWGPLRGLSFVQMFWKYVFLKHLYRQHLSPCLSNLLKYKTKNVVLYWLLLHWDSWFSNQVQHLRYPSDTEEWKKTVESLDLDGMLPQSCSELSVGAMRWTTKHERAWKIDTEKLQCGKRVVIMY